MPEDYELIGEYLLDKGLISREQFKEAADERVRTNRKVGEILVKRGYVKEDDIARAIADKLGFVFMELSSYKIDLGALELIPAQVAARLAAVPLFRVEDSLMVAMTNPIDLEAIDELSRASGGLRVKPVVVTTSAIKEAIAKYYGKQSAATIEEPRAQKSAPRAAAQNVSDAARLIQEAAQAPIVKLVNQLMDDAVQTGASDIHLEPEENSFHYRLRIDGMLHPPQSLPDEMRLAIISRIKIMAGMDIAQNRLPQDGRIQQTVLGRDIDMRIATFPTINGEEISIRILDKTHGILKMEELGFSEDMLKKVKDIIYKPYGIILVTGPTGSGKTTTLYSILNTINDSTKNIITLEDPVEYTIPNIHQSQVNVKAGLTFATGMRSIVRLDPDIIMIGEIRDKDTADIAIHSSLTGHLVFSTLHTNDAPSAASRLVDIGVEPYLLSSSLVGVLAQRLVRKLCPKCKEKYTPSKEELALFDELCSPGGKECAFYRPGACKDCHNTGYRGRTGIFELLIPNESIKELIFKKAPAYEMKAATAKAGMTTLRDDGLAKISQGITSMSEVLRVTEEE